MTDHTSSDFRWAIVQLVVAVALGLVLLLQWLQ